MQYPLFPLSHPIINPFFCHSSILQQTLILARRNPMHTATLMHLSEQAGCNADGDCAAVLEIVQACDAVSVRKRKLTELNNFFLFVIVFSRITDSLLSLMLCIRSRKHYTPACSGYVSQSAVSV